MGDVSSRRTGDLKSTPTADLLVQIENLRKELWSSRVKAQSGTLQQPHQIKKIRREIARIKTIISEKKTDG